jgi:hypothetical protein
VPTLVIGGRYDEVSPKEARNIHRRIAGSKLVTFSRSSHLAMWEERNTCNSVIREFVDVVRPTAGMVGTSLPRRYSDAQTAFLGGR